MEETLKSRKEIQSLFKNGKRISCFPIALVYLPNPLSKNRFVYCPERAVKTAVQRNRIKRKLRAVICEEEKIFLKGFDIAILAKKEILDLSHEKLVKILVSLINRIR
ncbi:ribonuclease P protein component [Leptospira borgpetersenii]|nr:ribonuclease P protein component [Leptospira borgpetersenii]AXX17077.1 ribonuclease P protein component [Leptospira borgpetersenii serovar Ceylonica]MBE8399586.1 ribonuclease P protein component [Leptospira borgpetersenii serovar Tarassovi]MBF3374301.1 ribonuclease P protein component [Leptospira borgpetersenii serovar Arborea]AWV71760.1 ribonuclease P protein component [Leptospira borgpetersenii serovar Hardjo-bovis]MBE8161289.1 ribonuclease P protein component [Leptospira borgpetersenii s